MDRVLFRPYLEEYSAAAPVNKRNHCLPNKRNRNETWSRPSELSGARQAARCPYDAAEPSWARSRCNSSSQPPIQYTAFVGLSHIFNKVTVTLSLPATGL